MYLPPTCAIQGHIQGNQGGISVDIPEQSCTLAEIVTPYPALILLLKSLSTGAVPSYT